MKKLLLLAATAAMAISTVNAQTPVKYHGEVDLGYSIGVGTFSTGRANLHTIQGVQVGRYFSAGLGLGLDYYHEFYDNGELAIPIYLNLKIGESSSLYLVRHRRRDRCDQWFKRTFRIVLHTCRRHQGRHVQGSVGIQRTAHIRIGHRVQYERHTDQGRRNVLTRCGQTDDRHHMSGAQQSCAFFLCADTINVWSIF